MNEVLRERGRIALRLWDTDIRRPEWCVAKIVEALGGPDPSGEATNRKVGRAGMYGAR